MVAGVHRQRAGVDCRQCHRCRKYRCRHSGGCCTASPAATRHPDTRCAADAPEGLITIENNLAVVDYAKNDLASRVAIERCPTGAIVWLDKRQGALKGLEARKVVRKEPLPVAAE